MVRANLLSPSYPEPPFSRVTVSIDLWSQVRSMVRVGSLVPLTCAKCHGASTQWLKETLLIRLSRWPHSWSGNDRRPAVDLIHASHATSQSGFVPWAFCNRVDHGGMKGIPDGLKPICPPVQHDGNFSQFCRTSCVEYCF